MARATSALGSNSGNHLHQTRATRGLSESDESSDHRGSAASERAYI